MAKSISNLKSFLSDIRKQHTPRSDRFEVVFAFPRNYQPDGGDVRRLSLFCEEAQIPGVSATNLPIKIGAWTEYRTQNVEFLSTDIVFTFVIDENWKGRELFEKWIQASVNHKSKEVAFYENSVANIEIKSLNTRDDVIGQWKIYEAIPKLINITPVSWSNTGFLRMSVSFSAKYWEKVYDDVGTSVSVEQRITDETTVPTVLEEFVRRISQSS